MTKDVDVDHNTPLMLAVEGGSESITKLLIGCKTISKELTKKEETYTRSLHNAIFTTAIFTNVIF